jgi:REP element-mobilizing transposase RayT
MKTDMTDKYKSIYRIPSTRWRDWDYGSSATYFVTACTAHREHFFGEIVDGEMQLSEIGRVVEIEWMKTPELRRDMNIMSGEYVVMPNHFHGIIVIGENQYNSDAVSVVSDADAADAAVETQCIASLQLPPPEWQPNKFGPQSKNLAAILRGFKSAVTKYATVNGIPFAWQTRFHDRVIRNYDEHNRIVQYINANIENWQDDELYV